MTPNTDTDRFQRAREIAVKIARRSVDLGTAEDIAQEVMLELFMLEAAPDNVDAWVTRVVRNRLIDVWRKKNRRPGLVPVEEIDAPTTLRAFLRDPVRSTSHAAMLEPVLQQIWDDLGSVLNVRELRVLQLKASGYPYAAIAEELGYAGADSVKVTVGRIRRKIRELGEEHIAQWRQHERIY